LQVILDEGYIANIAVEQAARRHGVASAMLDVFCRFGAENLAFLTLEVRASNQAAIALYEKHGFAQAGRRKNYYIQPKEDGIIMTREFDHGTAGTDGT
jgi:ribosomal-protein-alanine N-acetyltransferase